MQTSTNISQTVNPIPEHYRGAVPYLYLNDAMAALDFYKKAFGAKELICIRDNKNRVAHCEIEIGKARIMLSDEYPELNVRGPKSVGGPTSGFTLFFEDAEKVFSHAVKAGAKELRKVEIQFCGDIEGKLEDPFGHQWFIASHLEDVPYDVMKERAEQGMKTQ